MGHLASCLKKIEDVQFRAFANKGDPVAEAVKITKVDHCFYVLGKNGNVYTDGCLGRDICLNDYTNKAVKGLYQLGLITRKELRLHVKSMGLRKKIQESYERTENFKKRAIAMKINLNEGQIRILDWNHDTVKSSYDTQIKALAIKLNAEYTDAG
jgi:hypothetical protein